MRKSRLLYRSRAVAQTVWSGTRVLLAIGLAVWSIAGLRVLWREAPWLKVKTVTLSGSAPSGLVKASGVAPGVHLFSFSEDSVRNNVVKVYPEIAGVRVRRSWGGDVRLSAELRKPQARVFDGKSWLAVDAEGTVFRLSDAASAEALPVLVAADAKQTVGLLSFIKRLSVLDVEWPRGLQKVKANTPPDALLVLRDGMPVYWGDMDPSDDVLRRKAARLERVLRDPSLASGAEYVRFVDDARIAVKPVPEPGKETLGGEN